MSYHSNDDFGDAKQMKIPASFTLNITRGVYFTARPGQARGIFHCDSEYWGRLCTLRTLICPPRQRTNTLHTFDNDEPRSLAVLFKGMVRNNMNFMTLVIIHWSRLDCRLSLVELAPLISLVTA